MNQLIKFNEITWRDDPISSDERSIRDIVTSTGFFSREENDIAVELVLERLAKGVTSGYYFLFAEGLGNLIGYACFGPISGTKESYDLYWIAVRNDQRGLGLGKVILKRAEQNIIKMGGRSIYIETSSKEQYRPTQSFYEKCGYAKEAVLKDFYSASDDKFIYMKRIE
ncbi:GNAT family N-acetyltransferase [Thermodesulfobacteriota bacterium]